MITEIKNEKTKKQDTEIYNVLSRTIKEKRKIEDDTLEKGIHKRTIEPLELFYLKDGVGVATFCELKRIKKYNFYNKIMNKIKYYHILL